MYTFEFFKYPSPVVGKDVVAAIKSFFVSGKLLREVSATTITLASNSKLFNYG